VSVPAPAWTADEIVDHLKSLGSEQNRTGMARFGIATNTALGVGHTHLNAIARKVKKNHERALTLWKTGYREARILAGLTSEPGRITAEQCRLWATDFDSWDVVDGVSALFVRTPFWRELIEEFANDERHFVRRSAFAMLAWGAVHPKKEPDETFVSYLPLVERHASDERNFVKKAVNWALRQIGKRSTALHAPALALSEKLAASDDRTARWIGKDAVKELTAKKTVERMARKAKSGQ
jgi:3-methyladenine DNA glycosylase AlkD